MTQDEPTSQDQRDSQDGPDSPEKAGRPGTRGATRTYDGPEGVTVDWDAGRCLHVAACIRTAPAAFDPDRRPWVDLGAAPPEQVVAAVRACPTGALRLRDEQAAPPEPNVVVRPDGPLYVSGSVEVVDKRDGADRVLDRGHRVALCRCGKSGSAPFCDGSHSAVGFSAGSGEVRDGEPAPVEGALRVEVTDGPYRVSGAPVTRPDGEVLRPAGGTCSLCRCGLSGSKPFCDGSHARAS